MVLKHLLAWDLYFGMKILSQLKSMSRSLLIFHLKGRGNKGNRRWLFRVNVFFNLLADLQDSVGIIDFDFDSLLECFSEMLKGIG